MQQKTVLTADDVKQVLVAAEAEAKANNWAVTIVVVDDGGHPLGMQRLDGVAPISAYIATEKARTASLGRRESKIYEDMINNGRYSFMTAPVLHGMLEGGVPIVVNNQVVGAVGVSGVNENGCGVPMVTVTARPCLPAGAAAGVALVAAPVVLMFFLAQRTFIEGISMTGLKG